MSGTKFLQIHTLTSYPGTLLNRDDAGFAKRLPFGGATRTRVSSQCLKYHWRHHDGEHGLYIDDEYPRSVRSREVFRRLIAEPLIKEGYPRKLTTAATASLKVLLLWESKHLDANNKLKKSSFKGFVDPDDNTDPLHSGQVVVLGKPEVDYVRGLVAQEVDTLIDEFPEASSDELSDECIETAYSEFKDYFYSNRKKSDTADNLRALKTAAGLDAAMFGRMATSDVLARGDSAIQVAHAFTTHEEETENDYFSAVDELTADAGETGSGHINSSELTSGLFYGYVVIDVPQLISNTAAVSRENWKDADRSIASEVVRRFIHMVAKVSPGAKVGSTAPFSHAQCLLLEAGTSQPRTLANAFQKPASKLDVLESSYRKLGGYVSDMDQMYGEQAVRRLAGMGPIDALAEEVGVDSTHSVPGIADWAADLVRG